MPQILVRLMKEKSPDAKRIEELYGAMELLLNYTPLLDLVDTKCKYVSPFYVVTFEMVK